MKRLVVILFVFIGFSLSAQVNQVLSGATVTSDTYYWMKTDKNVGWRFYFEYTATDTTGTYILPYTKTTYGGTPQAYPGIDTVFFTASTGTGYFRDTYGPLDQYLGVKVVPGTGTVTISVWSYMQ